MEGKLVPGCQQQVKDGTVVVADSEKVRAAQKATLEYLLLNHPLDCPTCDQAGECFLQDYSYHYGRGYSRLQEPKNIKPDKDHIGDQITLFTDRCIMCSRCVRFTREISGTAELQVVGRGTHEEIDIFPGQPCNNKLAGNVVDLCPVGALCSKDFLYKQRVWWLKSANSVCPDCSTGCSIHVDQNDDHVYRLRPRPNPQAQGHFMCDEGRFGWKYLHAEERLTVPELKRRDGSLVSRDWDAVLAAVRDARSRRRPESATWHRRRALAVDDARRSVPAGQLFEVALRQRDARDLGRCDTSARTTSIRKTSTAGRWSRRSSRSAPRSVRIAAASSSSCSILPAG